MSNQNLIGHPICIVCLWPVPQTVSFSEWDSRQPTHCPTCDPVKPPAPAPEDTELSKRAEKYALANDVPHTKRDMPAWKYSVQDYTAGALAERELHKGDKVSQYMAEAIALEQEVASLSERAKREHDTCIEGLRAQGEEIARLREALKAARYDLDEIASKD